MKQRSVSSIFWDKRIEHTYSVSTSYLYLYLITCKHIGLTPYYFLPEGYVPIETGLSAEVVKKSMADLQERKQVYFFKNWVYIPNANEHNSFNTSEKTLVAYNNQLSKVPPEVLEHFNNVDNQVDNSPQIGYQYPMPKGIDTRSNSNSNSNNNSNKGDTVSIPYTDLTKQFIEKFNQLFTSEYEYTEGRKTKLQARLKKYTFEQILSALDNLDKNPWNHGKNDRGWVADPDFLLRNDEQIDRYLNYKPKKEFANAGSKDKYKNL